MTIEEIREKFEDVIGTPVPNNKKNDLEWMEKKVDSALVDGKKDSKEEKKEEEPTSSTKEVKQPLNSKKKELEEELKATIEKYKTFLHTRKIRNDNDPKLLSLINKVKELKEKIKHI